MNMRRFGPGPGMQQQRGPPFQNQRHMPPFGAPGFGGPPRFGAGPPHHARPHPGHPGFQGQQGPPGQPGQPGQQGQQGQFGHPAQAPPAANQGPPKGDEEKKSQVDSKWTTTTIKEDGKKEEKAVEKTSETKETEKKDKPEDVPPRSSQVHPSRQGQIHPDRMKMVANGGPNDKPVDRPPHQTHRRDFDENKKREHSGDSRASRFSSSSPPKRARVAPPNGHQAHRGPPGKPSCPPALQNEVRMLLNQVPPMDYADVLAAAVVGEAREPITDKTPGMHVEGTFDIVSKILGLKQLQMFKNRVAAKLHDELVKFMDEEYKTELSQFIAAHAASHPTYLMAKAFEVVDVGDAHAIAAAKAEIMRKQQARMAPPPVAAAPAPGMPAHMMPPAAVPAPAVPAPATPVSSVEQEKKLVAAALEGNTAAVSAALLSGANINAAHEGGWTAIMNATLQGHQQVVEFLISKKANLNLKDQSGFTALMYAASYQRAPIAQALVKAGADINILDNAGRNIWHYVQHDQVKAAIQQGLAARSVA